MRSRVSTGLDELAVKVAVPMYDKAGNLIFDMKHIYQYDAWNRLVQVRSAKVLDQTIMYRPEMSWEDPPESGLWYFWFSWAPGNFFILPQTSPWNRPVDVVYGPILLGSNESPEDVELEVHTGAIVVAGPVVKKYSYDGLGRLIRTRSPLPGAPAFEPETPFDAVPTATQVRSERYLYDGVRRVQEVVADYTLIGAAVLSWEANTAGTIGGGINYTGATGSGAGVTPTLAREYVWGPGDGPGGVDELLVQYGVSTGVSESAARETPWWILQDGGGDVVAVVKDNGWSAGENGATASTVAGQYVYDAYGSVLAAESLATHPALHLGHKGLFFDRLDVGVVDSGGAEIPRLDQGAHATYYMRNRWYSPETGRFLQRDPNATSMVLIESAASHGRGIGAAVAALSPDGMYGDGHNLYQYLGSNPWNRRDSLGLSADMVEDYQGVMLPLVELADGLLPIPILKPLTDLLDAFNSFLRTMALVNEIQDAAYAQEEMFTEVLDWKSSDDIFLTRSAYGVAMPGASSQSATGGLDFPPDTGPMFAGAFGGRIRPEQAKYGKRMEGIGRSQFGLTKAKRFRDAHATKASGQAWRDYDGVSGGKPTLAGGPRPGTYMEIKAGDQVLHERVRRQVCFDAEAIRQGNAVEWVFYSKPSQVSSELTAFLRSSNVPFRFAVH